MWKIIHVFIQAIHLYATARDWHNLSLLKFTDGLE